MPDLSVAIVCCNNAATIGRTLESVRGMAREIVAVDGGSTDGTLDLLAQHNARIVSSPWLGHVRTKQLALDHCAGPWVLCLDSDESAEPELRRSIERVLASEIAADVAGFEINRKVFYAVSRASPALRGSSGSMATFATIRSTPSASFSASRCSTAASVPRACTRWACEAGRPAC
jgi:glycosyltransferase involved in cell wall biosynthesis